MPAGDRPKPGFLQATVQPMQEALVGNSETALWVLMCAVAALLLIACFNLANAQLSRSILRQRETAIRNALGGSSWRLFISCIAESVLLAVFGGVGSVLAAECTVALLRHYSPIDLPRLADVHVDASALFFSLLVTIGCTLLFGFIPALKLMRSDPQAVLQQSTTRTAGTTSGNRLRSILTTVQELGCTALLLPTGLFVKHLCTS